MTSMRPLISLVASHVGPYINLEMQNAFHHGDLQEKTYMGQPLGFIPRGSLG